MMAEEIPTPTLNTRDLRKRALERLQGRHGKLADMPAGGAEKLVHELEVYQAELEVQNEELQRAQLQLSEALRCYQDLYERAPVGYLTLDAGNTIRRANHMAARLCSLELEELEGRGVEGIAHRDDHEKLWLVLRSAAATGQPQAVDLRIERPTGTPRWVHADVSMLSSSKEAAPGFRLTFTDITGQKKAEEELRRSEVHLSQAVQVAGLGIFEHDHRTETLHYSAAMRRMVGFSEQDPISLGKFLERVVPEDRQALAEAIETAHNPAGNGLFEQDFRVAHVGGTVRWLSARSETFFESSGGAIKPVRTIGAVVDVTERKQTLEALTQAKALLRQHADALEQTISEQTGELRSALEELEHFSYTITHDMRAPLRAMQGFADILLLNHLASLDDAGQVYIRRISQAAGRMDKLITDALNYSKTLRQDMQLQCVDTKGLLRGLVESYPHLQAPKAEVTLEENIPAVLGNEAGLIQVFSNYLANAVKFVPPGTSPKVRVWSEPREEYVRLWFEDNGTGIPQEYQGLIWDMFQKLDKQTEGTGVGLALVRKVVERMKGRVGVESECGKGSRFWVELKRCRTQ